MSLPIVRRDLVDALPRDLSIEVASYLTAKDLEKCGRVSKVWREIAGNEWLWEKLYPNFPKEIFPPGSTIRQIVVRYDCIANSKDEIGAHIKNLAGKIQFDQKAEFSCFFPQNQAYALSAQLWLGTGAWDKEGDLKETCLVLAKLEGPADKDSSYIGSSRLDYFGSIIDCRLSYTRRLPSVELNWKISDALRSRLIEHCSFESSLTRRTGALVGNAVLGAISSIREAVFPRGPA